MRLVFMGTPEFGVLSLQRLMASSHRVVGVVTQPDRPKGRGRDVAGSPIKLFAQEHGIPVLQPSDLMDDKFLNSLRDWHAECFIVVGFRILPPAVFEMPPKGTVNLHASLLPKYRGPAPIQWALIRGEEITGVTTFFIVRKVDSGDIILQKKVPIGREETAGELHDRLAGEGAELILETVNLIELGESRPVSQSGMSTPAPKILPETCEIDWNKPASELVNLIRGLSPRPGAFTIWQGKRMKVLRARVLEDSMKMSEKPGLVVQTTREGIVVETGKGWLSIYELLLEAGKPMAVKEFLKGHPFPPETILGRLK